LLAPWRPHTGRGRDPAQPRRNINQLARVANQTGELRRAGELSMVIDRLVMTIDRVIRL
jgi:hypothetical protein